MDVIDYVARKLYAAWSRPDAPDWAAWDVDGSLNGGGLKPESFRESARTVRDGLMRILCLDNGIAECNGCTFDTCLGRDFREEAEILLSDQQNGDQ